MRAASASSEGLGGRRNDLQGTLAPRVVVTGATGFVGCHLVDDLRQHGVKVLAIDNLRTGHNYVDRDPVVSFVRANFDSDEADIAIAGFAPDVVVHLAALHSLPSCRAHPSETLRVNASATTRFLSRLHRLKSLRRLVFASSAAVYGFSDDVLTERSELQPVDVYGESKVLGERSVREFVAGRADTSAVMLRFFNVFGSRETNPHLIPTLLRQISRGEAVEIGNSWPRRDYVHVRDVSRAVCLSLDADLDRPCIALNIATGRGTSVKEVVELLAKLSERPVEWREDPTQFRRVDGHLVGTGSRARVLLGWKPIHTLEHGLAELLQEELITL